MSGIGGRSPPIRATEYNLLDRVMETSVLPIEMRPKYGLVATNWRRARPKIHRMPPDSADEPVPMCCVSDQELKWTRVEIAPKLGGTRYDLCQHAECFRWEEYAEDTDYE